jgi:hypothetical protein
MGYWPVQINGNKFATGQILKKPVEIVKGRILAGGAQKSPEPWLCLPSSIFFLHSALASWPSVSKNIPSIKKKFKNSKRG